MRLWAELALALAVLGAVAPSLAEPLPTQPSVIGVAPTREAVREAVEHVRKDPNLPQKQTTKWLRLKESLFADKDADSDENAKPDTQDTPWFQWWIDFAQWLAQLGRVLVWALGAVAVVLFLVGLRHWVRVRAAGIRKPQANLPSHVRSLDIRPQSLPADIGAAAADLWQKGEHRAALSLLYRGGLSRLVHQHAVPISASSTEGECIALATARLEAGRSAFVAQLIGVWQRAVYGGELAQTQQVLDLCQNFERQLGSALPSLAGLSPKGAA